MKKIITFNKLKFVRDDKTGYYLNSTIHKRLHRYVWEFYNGPIPKGYEVHHIDRDKSNNDISNLQCISKKEHSLLHNKMLLTKKQREWRRKNFNEKARPAAIAWHKSKEGIEWHKLHAKNQVRPTHSNTCIVCGKEFFTKGWKVAKFCSGKCKAQERRDRLAKLKIEKTCIYCGNKYIADGNSKGNYCSLSCQQKDRWSKCK